MNYQMRKMAAAAYIGNLSRSAELIQNGNLMEKQALPWGMMARGGLALARRFVPKLLPRAGGAAMKTLPGTATKLLPRSGKALKTLPSLTRRPPSSALSRMSAYMRRHPYALPGVVATGVPLAMMNGIGEREDNPNLFRIQSPRTTGTNFSRGLRRLRYSIPGVMPGNNPTWDEERGL